MLSLGPRLTSTALAVWMALTAGAAAASCPTPEAMDANGVLLTTATGDIQLHQRTRENTIQIAENFGGGDGRVLEMHLGLYLKRDFALVNGVLQPDSERTFLGTRDAGHWAPPAPSTIWQNAMRGGGSASSGAEKTILVGTCRYTGYDISLRYTRAPDTVLTYAYLPTFGIGLLIRREDGSGMDTTRYISITAY